MANSSTNAGPKSEGGFISVEDFIRTRDSVVTGLTTLTGAINNLITAYIGHTNQLLGGQGASTDSLDTSTLTQLLNNAGLSSQVGTAVPAKKEKKKRAKKEKDPNAPKRPLTAFFLFSTNARGRVKEDLVDPTPVQVNDEILRRWKAMDEEQKKKWKDAYEKNNEEYKQAVAEYKKKTGKDLPVDAGLIDEEPDVEALEAVVGASDSESDDTSSEEETPVKKAPTPPAKKPKATKRKGKENGPIPPPILSPSPSAQLLHKETPIPLPGESVTKASSPEKRKKGPKEPSPEEPKKKKARKSKGVEDTIEVALPADKTQKKKKRKSEGF